MFSRTSQGRNAWCGNRVIRSVAEYVLTGPQSPFGFQIVIISDHDHIRSFIGTTNEHPLSTHFLHQYRNTNTEYTTIPSAMDTMNPQGPPANCRLWIAPGPRSPPFPSFPVADALVLHSVCTATECTIQFYLILGRTRKFPSAVNLEYSWYSWKVGGIFLHKSRGIGLVAVKYV